MRGLLLAATLAVLASMRAGAAPEEPAEPGAEQCTRPIDFADPCEASRWRVVGDRLMLGRSEGAVETREGSIEFRGTVRRRIGGGWCSARRDLGTPLALEDNFRIALEVRGDGKTYGFDLRDSAELDGIYWEAPIIALADAEWSTIVLEAKDFRPLRRGSPAEAEHPLDLRAIRSVALVIAGGQTGPYSIQVRDLRCTQAEAPPIPAAPQAPSPDPRKQRDLSADDPRPNDPDPQHARHPAGSSNKST